MDQSYDDGERVYAWCGPQPNRRLLLNYGIVDEANPYDRIAITATLPQSDRLYQAKRAVLTERGLATQQTFQMGLNQVGATVGFRNEALCMLASLRPALLLCLMHRAFLFGRCLAGIKHQQK